MSGNEATTLTALTSGFPSEMMPRKTGGAINALRLCCTALGELSPVMRQRTLATLWVFFIAEAEPCPTNDPACHCDECGEPGDGSGWRWTGVAFEHDCKDEADPTPAVVSGVGAVAS